MNESTKQFTAKHTPGPWIVKDDDIYSGVLVARAFTYPDTISFGERNANAALIAAAPELLLALKAILRDLPTKRDWLDPEIETIAKSAITKAEAR